MNEYGIKETEEALDAIVAIKDAYQAANADGTINQADIPLLFGLYAPLQKAIAGIKLVPKELGDLDSSETVVLVDKFGNVVNDPDLILAFEGLVKLGTGIQNFVEKNKEEAVA